MGRSQRHMLTEQNTTSAGEIIAQGEIAPASLAQAQEPELRGVEDVTVPFGPPGGPLQGSSMTGAIPESIGGPAPGPGPNPEPGFEPTLASLDPGTAVIGDPDLTLTCTGTNFTDSSIILFNGGEEATTVVSDTELTTIVKPSTAGTAGTFPVQVKQGDYLTGEVDFTFIEGTPVTTSRRRKKAE